MSLTCMCEYDGDGWYYHPPKDFTVLESSRSKRCCSCKKKLYNKDLVLVFDRYRGPKDEIEERINGDAVPLADWHMCEECGEIFLNLNDLGYCLMLGERSMQRYLNDYHKITGFIKHGENNER